MMTSLFLLLMFSLHHQTISLVDVSRQNNVIVDDNEVNNDNNNNTGYTVHSVP